jgi:hypothetical protein
MNPINKCMCIGEEEIEIFIKKDSISNRKIFVKKMGE